MPTFIYVLAIALFPVALILAFMTVAALVICADNLRSARAAGTEASPFRAFRPFVAFAVACAVCSTATYAIDTALDRETSRVIAAIEKRYGVKIQEHPDRRRVRPGFESEEWVSAGARWDCEIGSDSASLKCFENPVEVIAERVDLSALPVPDTHDHAPAEEPQAPKLPSAMSAR